MRAELKPCPFCGSEAVMITSEDGFTSIGCLNGHSFFGVMVQANTEAEAIEAWNARYERTCHIVGSYYDELMDEDYTDLSCGHHLRGAAWEFDFCSRCGAKVVSE